VGKKPPQSQKGGSHGLTPRTSAGLSLKEKKNKKQKIKIFIIIVFYFLFFVLFLGHRRPRGAPLGRLHLRRKPKE
jgi:hypothetical protein